MAKNIKTRAEDYSQWYLDVIKAAQLADYSPVRGCMVIRPEGFAIWEAIQRELDRRFKETGHVNAYFPLLIPQSFLTREAQHVEGFAMECAIVTHSRLEKGADGTLAPAGKLDEPLIIRPTSETVIGHMYSQWIQSYRDLPVLINQWCNVMRWEMRTRLFLRTAEFLWQEGHTAHETEAEAQDETLRMLDIYAEFAEIVLAIPVVKGRKTDSEKFPGAVTTYAIEALMQDGKALQCGTSHNLGQNFSNAFDIKFTGRDQKIEHAWTTSWGVSTRLIGAMIMAHSDDDGLVIPPRVASTVAVIIPIHKTADEHKQVGDACLKLAGALCGESEVQAAQKRQAGRELLSVFFDKFTGQSVIIDGRDMRPGDKQYYWEQHGVPFRIEYGPRDVDAGQFVLKRRVDRGKETVPVAQANAAWLRGKLDEAQQAMFDKALAYRNTNTHDAGSYDEMKALLQKGGFVRAFFKPDKAAEARIKDETKATVRCIPLETKAERDKCIVTGAPDGQRVLFAVAY